MGEVTLGDSRGRFVVGHFDDIGHYAIIKDYRWWNDNVDEIDDWLDHSGLRTGFRHEGMVLTFESQEDMALFLLRWAG